MANGMPIPIPPPYKIAWTFEPSSANIDPWMRRLAEGGFNLAQMYDPYYRGSKDYRDRMSEAAQRYGLQLMPFPGWSGSSTWSAQRIFDERRDDPAIWGWHTGEEPFSTGVSVSALRTTYQQLKSANPNWKAFIAFADGDWYAQGYATSGICDVFGVDVYPCQVGLGYLRGKLEKLFRNAIRRLVDSYGAEYCPVIMAHNEATCPSCIRDQYEIHREVVARPVKGLGYYLTSGFLPEAGGLPCIWNQIVAMNKALGGYSPAIITIETLTHACGANIQYQVSSVAAHNVVLTCPYDGASLGVNGLSGSAAITNIDEMASGLQGEITTLNGKIADLQASIEALEAQIAEAREIIGV